MWFKNLQLFQLSQPLMSDQENLDDLFDQQRFFPCPKVSPHSAGWINPIVSKEATDLDPAQSLHHSANGYRLICLMIEERLLPNSVVKQTVNEKIAEIEQQHDRKVRRREKSSLQDEAYFSLLPKAFTKQSRLYAYIDTKKQHLILDAANKKQITLFLDCWQKTFSDIKLVKQPLTPKQALLTAWIRDNQLPDHLETTEHIVLRQQSSEKTVVRCQNQDVFAEEIARFIQHDYVVVQLGIEWNEKMRCNLKEDGSVGSLRFLDLIQELSQDSLAETPEQRFDADFVIMTEAIAQLVGLLLTYAPKDDPLSQDNKIKAATLSAETA